jgi:fatty-acyl-CoA synthase
MTSIFDQGLAPRQANFAQLSPATFAERSGRVFPNRLAVVHGLRRSTWAEVLKRSRQLAQALIALGVGKNDTVALMLLNTPEMVEAHYAVPGMNAVMLPLNVRLDAASIAFMLGHGQAKVVLCDFEFFGTMTAALEILKAEGKPLPQVIDVLDSSVEPDFALKGLTGSNSTMSQKVALDAARASGTRLGTLEYEGVIAQQDGSRVLQNADNEWDAISLAYTSGTTGQPKGVVTHHRGAYLNAVSNLVTWAMPMHPVYLWTLPMFHCDGWCFPWSVAAQAGTHVCLRKVDPAAIFKLMKSEGVTHYCGAPIVHNAMINEAHAHPPALAKVVKAMVAGAAPPAAMIEGLEAIGIEVTHVYGLTEVYGPAVVCPPQAEWAALPLSERARLNARQGVRYPLQDSVEVLDPETMLPVPHDGETMGEVMFRGNITMKGYLNNPEATEKAFAGGWFHSGDLAVVYPDGYLKIKDRSKDIIISGGENISSIEIEDVLYRHPAVLAAAVVAMPHDKWGETPCAFVELKASDLAAIASDAAAEGALRESIVAHCRQHLAGFKLPRAVSFGELPKTSTGKIQKFELRVKAGSIKAIDV